MRKRKRIKEWRTTMKREQVDELAAEERREYFRKWRAANKDKVAKHNANYWRKKAEQKLQEQQIQENQ